MLNSPNNTRSLSKVELLPLYKEAHQNGYQPGKYQQLYLAAHAAPVDITQEQTRRLQCLPAPTMPVVRNTNSYDLRVIALPHTLDGLIKDYQAINKKMPDEIRLKPASIEVLRQAGFVRNNKYRGLITLTPDASLDANSIHLDRYDIPRT